MKFTIETIELSPEELAIFIKPEGINVTSVGNIGKSVADILKEAEFYRQQKESGRTNF